MLLALLLAASGEELVLTDEVQKVRVVLIAQSPGAEQYWAKWSGLPGEKPWGTAVFVRSESGGTVRLDPPAGGAPFSLASYGQRLLVKGSTVPAWQLSLAKGPPLMLVLSAEPAGPAEALAQSYREEHGLVPLKPAKLEEARKQVAAACGTQLAVTADTGVAVVFLRAIAEACSDTDYREAVKKLKGVKLEKGKGFECENKNGTLVIRVGEDVANPQAQMAKWLRESL